MPQEAVHCPSRESPEEVRDDSSDGESELTDLLETADSSVEEPGTPSAQRI